MSKRILADVEVSPFSLSATARAVCNSTVFGCLLTFAFVTVVVLVVSLSFTVFSSVTDKCELDCICTDGGAYYNVHNFSRAYNDWHRDPSIGN